MIFTLGETHQRHDVDIRMSVIGKHFIWSAKHETTPSIDYAAGMQFLPATSQLALQSAHQQTAKTTIKGLEYSPGRWLIVKSTTGRRDSDRPTFYSLRQTKGHCKAIGGGDAFKMLPFSALVSMTDIIHWKYMSDQDQALILTSPNMKCHITFRPTDGSEKIIVPEYVLIMLGKTYYLGQDIVEIKTEGITAKIVSLIHLGIGTPSEEKPHGRGGNWLKFIAARNNLTPAEFVKYHLVLNEILRESK